LLGFVAIGGACARTPAPPPGGPNADGFDLRQLAAEMDDPSAAPLWPMVPADLKKLVVARGNPGDIFPDPFYWQFSTGLGAPPTKPTLIFSMSDDFAWLIASPRLCSASRAPP